MAVARQYVEKDRHAEDEYFAFEQTTFGRWEYVDGQIRGMVGGTDDHNTVCSPATAGYDRAEKFNHYRTIPSLIDYPPVSPDEARVLLHTRDRDHWDFREVKGLAGTVSLASVGVTLALGDVYALIELAPD